MKARGQPNSHGVKCGKFWAAVSEVPPDSLHLVPGIRDRREYKAQSPMDGLSLPPTCTHMLAHVYVRAHAHTLL